MSCNRHSSTICTNRYTSALKWSMKLVPIKRSNGIEPGRTLFQYPAPCRLRNKFIVDMWNEYFSRPKPLLQHKFGRPKSVSFFFFIEYLSWVGWWPAERLLAEATPPWLPISSGKRGGGHKDGLGGGRKVASLFKMGSSFKWPGRRTKIDKWQMIIITNVLGYFLDYLVGKN